MPDKEFTASFVHRLRFTRRCFDPANPLLAELLTPGREGPASALVIIDDNVVRCHYTLPTQIEKYITNHTDTIRLAGPISRIPGGEVVKNDPKYFEQILDLMNQARLCRQSYAIAIGGGAVLDVVGLAAALCHRGVRLIRIATTTLAQADSAVGVKNGINAYGKKNYMGVFACPWAVINDEHFLSSLADEDWLSGFSEVVKVALLKDPVLFDNLEAQAATIRKRSLNAAVPMIRRSAELHFDHITLSGDPFELSHVRPLDFGHWAAHKLEQMSEYTLRHGLAVAIGLAVDVTYACLSGLLDRSIRDRIVTCLETLGFELYHPELRNTDRLLEGLEEFREHLGGQLTIPLITDVGNMKEVHEINHDLMKQAINQFVVARKA